MLHQERNPDPMRSLQVQGPGASCYSQKSFDLIMFESPVTQFTAQRRDVPVPRELTGSEAARYAQGLESEYAFLTGRLKRDLPPLPSGGDVQAYHKFFQEQREGKLTLRDISYNSGNLSATWGVGPYPAYNLFAESPTPALAAFGANVGSSLMLLTSDGRLILQCRSDKNDKYKGTIAVAAAGLVNAPKKDDAGTIDVLRVSVANLLREGSEEIGLRERYEASLGISAIVIGKQTLHHEIPFRLTSTRTASELLQSVRTNEFKDSPVAFREAAVAIPATSDAIRKLLVESRCPIPDTHAGMLVQEALRARLETENSAAAYRWFGRLFFDMEEQAEHIGKLCGGSYNPNRTLEEQGLPPLREELKRLFGQDVEFAEPPK